MILLHNPTEDELDLMKARGLLEEMLELYGDYDYKKVVFGENSQHDGDVGIITIDESSKHCPLVFLIIMNLCTACSIRKNECLTAKKKTLTTPWQSPHIKKTTDLGGVIGYFHVK